MTTLSDQIKSIRERAEKATMFDFTELLSIRTDVPRLCDAVGYLRALAKNEIPSVELQKVIDSRLAAILSGEKEKE